MRGLLQPMVVSYSAKNMWSVKTVPKLTPSKVVGRSLWDVVSSYLISLARKVSISGCCKREEVGRG